MNIFLVIVLVALSIGEFVATQECGLKAIVNRRKRMIGGDYSRRCEWPWAVYLSADFGDGIVRPIGTATLVGDDAVLVSGQLANAMSGAGANTKVFVTVGEYDTRIEDPKEEKIEVNMTSIAYHQGYTDGDPARGNFPTNNIGMLKLKQNITRSECVQPVCLTGDKADFDNDNKCWLVGWGQIYPTNNQISSLPLTSQIHMNDNHYCSLFPSLSSLPASGYVCALGVPENGQNPSYTCEADVGNIIMCNGREQRWFLRGIVAYNNCGPRKDEPFPVIDVAAYNTWIEANRT